MSDQPPGSPAPPSPPGSPWPPTVPATEPSGPAAPPPPPPPTEPVWQGPQPVVERPTEPVPPVPPGPPPPAGGGGGGGGGDGSGGGPAAGGGGGPNTGLVVAIVVAVLAVLGVGAFLLFSGDDDDDDVATEQDDGDDDETTTTTERETTTTTAPETTTTTAPETTTTTAGAGELAFTRVTDDTGQLTVEVPDTWTDLDGRPLNANSPNLQASTDLEAFRALEASGISFSLLEERNPDPDTTLDFLMNDVSTLCDVGDREDYDDTVFAGRVQQLSDCRGLGVELFIIVASDVEGRTVEVSVAVAPPDPAEDVVRRVVETFLLTS